jgi:ABC-type uncharacterized transport system substrate-binding protein
MTQQVRHCEGRSSDAGGTLPLRKGPPWVSEGRRSGRPSSRPVALGRVARLARPGGNLTGVSWEVAPEVNAKMVQMLREGLPRFSRVAVLWNPANPGSERYFAQTNDAGRRPGVTVISIPLSAPERLRMALQRIARRKVDAIVLLDPLTVIHRARIVGFAADQRLRADHVIQ